MDKYQVTFQSWDQVAARYQDKFMDMDLYDDTYDFFCRQINKIGARIFEIGCGPGNITKYLLMKWPDFKIDAIDVSASMIELAKENNPTVNFICMDCREIARVKEKFDAVVCGFCMPYLSKEDCLKLIKDCNHLLNQRGILYFSTIEGDYAKSGYETDSSGVHKMYVYYHEENSLQKALTENNFEVLDLSRRPYAKSPGVLSNHMIFTAIKNG